MTPNAEARIEGKLDSLLDLTARMDERLQAATDTLRGHDAAIVAERSRVDAALLVLSDRVTSVEGRGRFTWSDVGKVLAALAALSVVAGAAVSVVIHFAG